MSYRDLIGEVLADHYESPRSFGELEQFDFEEEGYNPVCGDRIHVFGKVKNGCLDQCKFEGDGCSICLASASILMERIQGHKIEDVSKLIESFRLKMQGQDEVPGLPSENDTTDDIVALYGIKKLPVRIKCALLSWTTLNAGLKKYLETKA